MGIPVELDNVIIRNSTAAEWTADNPLLLEGEFGHETDTDRFKLGDGSNLWSALAYRDQVMPLRMPIHTVASAPSAVTYTRTMIFVTDGGANEPCYSDGTNWLKTSDGSIVI